MSSRATDIPLLRQRAKHGMFALMLRHGLGITVNILGTFVLSRMVGPEIWGAFAIAQVVYISSQEILGRGVATYLIKKRSAPSELDIRNTFALQHLVGTIFFCVAAVVAVPAARWYSHRELVPLLFAAALATYLYAWRSVPVALLERELDYVKVAFIEILDSVAFSATAITFAWLGHATMGLAAAIAARAVISTATAYVVKHVRPALFCGPNSMQGVAGFGGTMTGISLLNIAILFVPAILVGKLASIGALALLQMAFSLYGNLLFASAAILRLSFSTYARIADDAAELKNIVAINLEMTALIFVPVIVVFAGLSPLWVPFAFGAKWGSLPLLFLVLAPAYLLSSVFWGILSSALSVSGQHRKVLFFLAVFLSIYAPAVGMLTIKFGTVGGAAAFSATHAFLYPFLLIACSRGLGGLKYRKLGFQLMIGLFSTLLVWMISRYSTLMGCAGAAIYLMLWYLGNSDRVHSLLRLFQPVQSSAVVAGEKA